MYSYIDPKFYYKLQKIVSCDNSLIGYEVLLDFSKAKNCIPNKLTTYYESIDNGTALEYLLYTLLNNQQFLFNTKLFINVERRELCNIFNLIAIIAVSKKLLEMNAIELVVEVTERKSIDSDAVYVISSLNYLKSHNISLAVDDFDIYNDDFRFNEVNLCTYDIIKIRIPQSVDEAIIFNGFVSERKEKIILELVEDRFVIEQFGLTSVYGYQGFAYE